MATIKFRNDENRIKGLEILFRSRFGFHGFSNGNFVVKEEQLSELQDHGVEFDQV